MLLCLCVFVVGIFSVLARCVLNGQRHDTENTKSLTVPPPPTSPERRLPLRQQPSERSFSASPRYVDPVRNDWVLPHLKPGKKPTLDKANKPYKSYTTHSSLLSLLCLFVALPKFVTSAVTVSVFLRQKLAF
jgi:hypothetical protein